jgi:hypothetical protein
MSDYLAINNFPLPHHEGVESFIEMDGMVLDCAILSRVSDKRLSKIAGQLKDEWLIFDVH